MLFLFFYAITLKNILIIFMILKIIRRTSWGFRVTFKKGVRLQRVVARGAVRSL